MSRAAGLLLKLVGWPLLLVGIAWGVLALWFDGPTSRLAAGALGAVFAVSSLALPALVRPFRRGLLAASLPLLLVVVWWSRIAPSNDRDWMPDVARLPRATIDGDRVTIENVRNFVYRSENDYDPHWETRTYDLDQLRGVDLFLSFWGPTLIAHTIASWEFADGRHLAISIETRKEKGESYSAVRGFFRQYELYYVVADERDVVGLRTNYRGERVFLYRIRQARRGARDSCSTTCARSTELAEHPRWYNALTHNCTTDHPLPRAERHRRAGRGTGDCSPTATSTSSATSAARSTPACPSRSCGGAATSPSGRRAADWDPTSRSASASACRSASARCPTGRPGPRREVFRGGRGRPPGSATRAAILSSRPIAPLIPPTMV